MFTADRRPAEATTEEPPDLHQLVHQRLRTTIEPLDVNSKISTPTGKLHIAKGRCFQLQIKWLAATFPRPLKYPRRDAGRKGAFGVACDGAIGATLAPVTTTSTAARTRERGRSRGGLGNEGQEVPCPLRALQGRHSRSFTAIHGQSKPLFNGCVLRMSCSSKLTISPYAMCC